MKLISMLLAVSAALFIVGGIGTIVTFIARAAEPRLWFMWTFLAGLVPSMILVTISFVVGAYHLYLSRKSASGTPNER